MDWPNWQSAAFGVAVGWGLKLSSDYISGRIDIGQALLPVEAELGAIRVAIEQAVELRQQATRTKDEEQARSLAARAETITVDLPAIEGLHNNLRQVARVLPDYECNLLVNSINLYNVRRKAHPNELPELDLVKLLFEIVYGWRMLSNVPWRLAHPVKAKNLKIQLKGLVARGKIRAELGV